MRNDTDNIDLAENREAYIKKMSRQLKEAEKQVKTIEKIARRRNAGENMEVRRSIEDLEAKLNEARECFEGLKEDNATAWPDASRGISAAYKDLEATVGAVETKVKPK